MEANNNRLILHNVSILQEQSNKDTTNSSELTETHVYIYKSTIEHIGLEPPDSIDKKYLPIIDCKGYIAIPGMIDVHTHIREPGLSHKENFRSGSMAAAMGGVTAFFDMPNTIPPTTSYINLMKKRSLAHTSIVDYALHFGATEQTKSKEIQAFKTPNLQDTIIPPSVKIFLNESTGNLTITSHEILEEIVQHAWCICAHAEEEKIETIISLAQKYSVPLYLVHISRKSEMDYITAVKKQQDSNATPIYVEVCPHHLAFTKDDISQNPLLSMKPSLQSKLDQQSLWDAIENNMVDCIGSDHAPHTLNEKIHALKHNQRVYGVPNLETSLLYLLDAHARGKLSLEKIIKLCSSQAAKIFPLKQKGSLKAGMDADIALVSLRGKATLFKNGMVISKAGWSIFDNYEFQSSIAATICRGSVVFLSHNLGQAYRNKKKNITLQSNALGSIFLHRGKELRCHDV